MIYYFLLKQGTTRHLMMKFAMFEQRLDARIANPRERGRWFNARITNPREQEFKIWILISTPLDCDKVYSNNVLTGCNPTIINDFYYYLNYHI